MKICKLPIAIVYRFDKTSYFYILLFFRGKLAPLRFSFRGPARNLRALGYWAPVSLFPCNFFVLRSNMEVYLYNYSYSDPVELNILNILEGKGK